MRATHPGLRGTSGSRFASDGSNSRLSITLEKLTGRGASTPTRGDAHRAQGAQKREPAASDTWDYGSTGLWLNQRKRRCYL